MLRYARCWRLRWLAFALRTSSLLEAKDSIVFLRPSEVHSRTNLFILYLSLSFSISFYMHVANPSLFLSLPIRIQFSLLSFAPFFQSFPETNKHLFFLFFLSLSPLPPFSSLPSSTLPQPFLNSTHPPIYSPVHPSLFSLQKCPPWSKTRTPPKTPACSSTLPPVPSPLPSPLPLSRSRAASTGAATAGS